MFTFCLLVKPMFSICFRFILFPFQIVFLQFKCLHQLKCLQIGYQEFILVELFPDISHPVFFQPISPSTSVFLLVDDSDLQQHLPTVVEGSGRGVSCGGRGRSVPRALLLPLGGALSLHWWWRAPRSRRVLTGHCVYGPVWTDTENTQKADK